MLSILCFFTLFNLCLVELQHHSLKALLSRVATTRNGFRFNNTLPWFDLTNVRTRKSQPAVFTAWVNGIWQLGLRYGVLVTKAWRHFFPHYSTDHYILLLFSVLEQLNGKTIVMSLLCHSDPNVRYEALLAVQKLMVHNWWVVTNAQWAKYCYHMDITCFVTDPGCRWIKYVYLLHNRVIFSM
jgi:hypothetical protein